MPLLLVLGFLLPLSAFAGPTCTFTSTPFLPGNTAYEVGQSITSSLSCTGTGTVTYLWRLNGVTVPGETGPSYTFTPSEAAVYIVTFIAADDTGGFQGGWERNVALKLSPTATRVTQGTILVGQPVVFQGEGAGDIDEYYHWSIFSDPNGNSSGGIQPKKQITFTPGSAGPWTIRLVLNNGVASEPADITFDVEPQPVNLPPVAALTATPASASIGQTITLDGSASSDPENAPLTYQWSLVTPPSGAAPFPPSTGQSIRSYVPTVPGTYRFQLVVNDSVFNSDPVQQLVEVSALTLTPKFKVLLDNEEYLSNDCAPNNDQCKVDLAGYTAGEFLVKDVVTLDGSESTGASNLTYKWTVNGTEINSTGQKVNYSIPSEGDYEIKLVVSSNSIDSQPLTKKLKGRLSIEPTYPSPGPFYQKKKIGNNQDNPNYLAFNWGNTGIDDFSKFGCAVVATGNLLNRDLGLTSTRQVDNLYKNKNVYYAVNRILWEEVARARNSQLSNTTEFWKYKNKGNDPVVAEKFARKRKFGGLAVRSLSDPTNLDKQHFVTLSGVGVVGTQKILRIVDPAEETRVSLDDPKFDNRFRELRAFEIEPIATPDTLRVYVSTSNTGIQFSSLRASGKTFRLSNGNADVKSFAIGTVTLENLGDDSDPTSTESSGGYLMAVPDAQAGSYSVNITATAQTQGEVEIRVFNTSNQVNLVKIVGVSLSPGQTKEIQFDVSNQDVTLGALDVSGFAVRKDLNGKSITRIEGMLNAASGSNGFNFSSETVNISLSSLGYELLPGDIQNISDTYKYANYASQSGLRFIEIQPNGIFKLEVVDLNLLSLVSSNSAPLEIQIGDDRLSGVVNKESIIAASKMWLELSKLSYVNGERAEGLIATSVRPTNSELETYLDLKIDGQQNLTSVDSTQSWTFRSPRLVSGEHSIVASLFLQNKRLAGQVGAVTKAYRLRIFEIDERLGVETDPEIVQQLMFEKQGLYERISALESTLRESRTAIGTPLYDSIIVQ